MNDYSDLLKDPLILGAIALMIVLLSAIALLRRGSHGAQATLRQDRQRRDQAVQILRNSNAFQMLELTEADARTVMDIVVQDNVKLEGKYKRAAQHIQTAAYERERATLSEEQITAVLVAYRQAASR